MFVCLLQSWFHTHRQIEVTRYSRYLSRYAKGPLICNLKTEHTQILWLLNRGSRPRSRCLANVSKKQVLENPGKNDYTQLSCVAGYFVQETIPLLESRKRSVESSILEFCVPEKPV